MPLPVSATTFSGSSARYIDQPQHRRDELLGQIQLAHAALARHRGVGVALDDPPQILDALVAAEQVGHLAHHLEAVVLLSGCARP